MNKRHVVGCMAGLLLLALAATCQSVGAGAATPDQMTPAERAKAGKALFEEKCRTVAGEKIYRKVDNVEGLLLLKVRPQAGAREWADSMWPGAAFASEAFGDGYLNTFLGFEYSGSPLGEPVSTLRRGYINTDHRAGGLPGYRYVDVIDAKDGKRYRYAGSNKVVGRKDVSASNVKINLERDANYDLNIYGWVLDKTPTIGSAPRYGVTYEDHMIPADRALGVASSTVTVLDLKTNEILGEMTRYAWSPGTSGGNPSPWLTAYKCPSHAAGSDALTRKFVDQILIPKKGN